MRRGKAAFSAGEGMSSVQLRPAESPFLEPIGMCLVCWLQGLIPDTELGEGDACTEISAHRQLLAFVHTLSPPLKTFWKTEQKQ